jgi:hypothetical protein
MAVCPICGSHAEALDRTGDAEGFDCPQHGAFKVSDTALASQPSAGRPKWEAALKLAKERVVPGEWPCVTTYDLTN